MQTDYLPFVEKMIRDYEGGYCWDKGDPGGPTKYGVTCFDLAEHRGQRMTSMSAWAPIVKAMPLAEADDIYRTKYATKLFFDQLNPGKDVVIYDYGVNSGVGRPPKVARALLNIGQGTDLIQAINKADPKWFIESMCAERLHFMHQIRNGSAWAQFGHGWGARVANLQAYAEHLADGGHDVTAPVILAQKVPQHPKAQHGNPNIVHDTIGQAGAAGAAAGTGAVATSHHTLAIIGGCVTVAGIIGLALYEANKHAKANDTVVLPASIKPMPGAHL